MDKKENPKCSTCRCYWIPDETDVKSSGLYFKTCKKCRDNNKKIYKKYREENADKIKEYKKQYREENADKVKEQNKKYYEENADKIKEQVKKYREENADMMKENNKKYNKKYREENADKEKERRKKYYEVNKCEHNKEKKCCKECNILLYLVNLQRKQINRCFKNSSLEKVKHSIEYLGCTVEYLIEHFNKKIEYFNTYLATDTLMTYDNIHIDHIKPVSRFDLDNEDEFLDCCHYTNLQPLIGVDNLEKSNRWTDENNAYWLVNIKGNDDYKEIYV